MSGTVGIGFGAFRPRMKVNRIPKNPMDKCTIVSIYTKPIVQYNPTLFPGMFEVPAAKPNEYSTLIVEASSWIKEQTDGMPFLEIPVSSIQVAESIIRDYCVGLLGYVPQVAGPGVFFIMGKHTPASLLDYKTDEGVRFNTLLSKATEMQKQWYLNIIKIADIGWSRTDGNPLAINDDARMAAEMLGLKDKPWMQDFATLEKKNCPACGSLVNPAFPVCSNCKNIIDVKKAEELNLVFAK